MAPELRAVLDRLPPEERTRCERIHFEAREILLKYLTQEEYQLLYGTDPVRVQSHVGKDMLNRVAFLMKEIESKLTAEEKRKVAEAGDMERRLLGLSR
jgi:hypothetical protein